MINDKYPCPCCGHLGFNQEPGSLEICQNCFWQDDSISLKFPKEIFGPNEVSLIEAQQNFINFGASELRFIETAAKRRKSILVNINNVWRPISRDDYFLDSDTMNRPEKQTDLYYWLDTYWLKK